MTAIWYPGHMSKAKRTLLENIKLVDLVIEVRDARAPQSTANPDLRKIARHKPLVVALNKSDLADPAVTALWNRHLQAEGHYVASVNALAGQGFSELIQFMRSATRETQQKRVDKGIRERAGRVMVVGIPNVGKSQMINRLVGRTAARTGDQPGITRGKQWVKIAGDFELLDTPGILWPKLQDPAVRTKLAMVAAINEGEYNAEEISLALLTFLSEVVPDRLLARYKMTELSPRVDENLEFIGRKRGCLRAGGEVDLTKAAVVVIRDFQEGLLGRISLELPGEDDPELPGEDEPKLLGEDEPELPGEDDQELE